MTSTTGKARGPYARSAQRRQDIARAVLNIVLDKGHGNVTTAEVAARSATREATVMYHFPTKDHLLVAALRAAEVADDAGDPVGRPAATFELEQLRTFARAVPRRESVMRLYTALAGSASIPGHPAQEYFVEHYRDAVGRFALLVEQRQAEGLAHAGLDPVEVARQFVATWDGLQAQWLVRPEFDLGDELVAAFRRLTGQNWMEARSRLMEPDMGL